MSKVRVFLIFVYLFIPLFEETLMWYFMAFVKILSWLHDRFMWMVDEIFHFMFDMKKGRFCWCIHKSTGAPCEILKIIPSLDSGVNESTNPVI